VSGGGGGVNKSAFKRVRARIYTLAGERYTVNDSGGGYITAGQQ